MVSILIYMMSHWIRLMMSHYVRLLDCHEFTKLQWLGTLDLFVLLLQIIQVRANYPRLIDLMQQKQKKHIFKILGSKGEALKKFTCDLCVPKSITLGEDEAQRVWRSHVPNIFCPMTRTMILTLQSVGFEREEFQTLYFQKGKTIVSQK